MATKIEGYPPINLNTEKIFITVKTYPHPSVSYLEIVCTAGLTTKGRFIRLYPVKFRYLENYKQYKKIPMDYRTNKKI